MSKDIGDLKVEIMELRDALRFYAEKEKWHQLIAGGSIGSAQEGDICMMFDDGEDAPWSVAQDALAYVHQQMHSAGRE